MSFICVDRIPGLLDLPDPGTEFGEEACGDAAYYWPTGTALTVRFLDGPPDLRARVMAAAGAWTEHANLSLTVVDTGPADLRITFRGAGNWSALGTTSRNPRSYPADHPTMCLAEAGTAGPSRLARIARHEFGHAIGLVHEHSSPAAGIAWNRPVVLNTLAGPPNFWSMADVAVNVFDRYHTTRTQYTAFDPHSIMLYAFPPEWTLDGRTFPENVELSATDRAFAAQIYP
ncbi:Tolloid-like protein 1 [Actinoplanes sp. M2I2]|uniref:Tolloid-like protein 1 n=1 Tax=Actinoplanes sp. M2I2 TaxID=1734444 RepID=UPI002021ADDF|nr:Tolloid-like protein 1 [Actinoplanes sp. M2I2]